MTKQLEQLAYLWVGICVQQVADKNKNEKPKRNKNK